jgi:cytochrome P450
MLLKDDQFFSTHEDDLLNEVIAFFAASITTSSGTLINALYYLRVNPNALVKVREEIK